MKLLMISNKITPHQVPICKALYEKCQGEFRFLETMRETGDLPIGWVAKSEEYPFVKTAKDVYEGFARTKQEICEADAVIIGSAPDSFVADRLKSRKLTFRYSERFYKQGLNRRNFLKSMIGAWLHHGRYQRYPLYMLCASAYTAADAAVFHNYQNRCYTWGYFPPLERYEPVEQLMEQKDPQLIVWAARQIDWKHPEVVIELAKRLKQEGIPFHIRMIGDGEMSHALQEQTRQMGLTDCVSFPGSIPPADVRRQMGQAGIFLFTSDFREGWGAVCNEAMNSGCAVVASHAIGSVPYLITNGDNGYIYENGNTEDLFRKVKHLLQHPDQQRECGKKAYAAIRDLWNGDVAAERFLALCEALKNGDPAPHLFENGPCSIAEKIKNDWYHSEDRT